ncbi:MAG: GTPase Era [Candidatus Sumerlaeota bacterium]|nr:GTPase Era [Candidatus Sumerlaeota bacterium]
MTDIPQASAIGFVSGYVTILGRPNAGKSTLLNALVGGKIAITSERPQTTRDRVAGILTTDHYQIVFLDTPGVIAPRDRFNETLVARVAEALDSIDVLYHIVDAANDEPQNERLAKLLEHARPRAKFLLVNKTDKLTKHDDPAALSAPGMNPARYDEVFFISALRRKGLNTLLERTVARLAPGPLFYDPEQISDRDERFMAAEIVREKVFRHTGAEVPYAVFTEIEVFEERPGRDFISVVIYVERDSQKGILIGGGGRMMKTIGSQARAEIEKLTGRPAFLQLHVKVRKNWRKNEHDLASFGFKKPK